MLSNAYFLAKFRFDTAENEPAENLQKFANNHFVIFAHFANPNHLTVWTVSTLREGRLLQRARRTRGRQEGGAAGRAAVSAGSTYL